MPDIEFNLDSAVGDHKITSGQIAFFLINRLKVPIRYWIIPVTNIDNTDILIDVYISITNTYIP